MAQEIFGQLGIALVTMLLVLTLFALWVTGSALLATHRRRRAPHGRRARRILGRSPA